MPSLPLTVNDGLDPEVDNPAANETVAQSEKYYNSYLYVVTETFFEGMATREKTRYFLVKKYLSL